MTFKTFNAKPSDIERKWYIVDAKGQTLGRLSTQVATLLTGKSKPQFTKHIDCGDYVIVINANDLHVSGGKTDKKIYYKHSGYPGGLKETQMKNLSNKDVIIHSIRGMLPVNKLRPNRLMRLKVYGGADHEHTAQKPLTYKLITKNTMEVSK